MRYVDQTEPPTKNKYPLFTLTMSHTTHAIVVPVEINNMTVNMEIDTGATVSLVSEETYNQHWPQQQLEESNTRLKTYSGEHLETLGNMNVSVCYSDQQVTLPLVVIKGKGPSLFGRNWLEKTKLNWPEIHKLQEDPVGAILRQHAKVFEESLGTLTGFTAQVHIDPAVEDFVKLGQYRMLIGKWLMLS